MSNQPHEEKVKTSGMSLVKAGGLLKPAMAAGLAYAEGCQHLGSGERYEGTPTEHEDQTGQREIPTAQPGRMAIAFGGVLIAKGMPKEHAMATIIALEGAGSIAVASGTSTAAVAVLLMRAEKVAATNTRAKRRGARSERVG